MTTLLWTFLLIGAFIAALSVLIVLLAIALYHRADQVDLLRGRLVLAEDETRRVRADLIAAHGQLAAMTDERTLMDVVINQGIDDLLGGRS